MNKFKDDEIDKEFFKNDFYINQLENPDDVERYKCNMRNTYDYAFYRWSETVLPYKLGLSNWIEDRVCRVIDFVNRLILKITK